MTHPTLIEQWCWEKNMGLNPEELSAGSSKKVWWKCSQGDDHIWQASPGSRCKGSGCPFCAGRRVSVTNNLLFRYPELANEWHPRRNGAVTPDRVLGGGRKRVWWKCKDGPDHEWESTLENRTNFGRGCPFCAGRRASQTNSLLLHPEIASQLDLKRNNGLSARDVVAKSPKKLWWKCDKVDDHAWMASPFKRVTSSSGCPICADIKHNSLQALFPEIAGEWHESKNGATTPSQVLSGSDFNAWWQCKLDPQHEWKTSVITRTKIRSGCPFCIGKKVARKV